MRLHQIQLPSVLTSMRNDRKHMGRLVQLVLTLPSNLYSTIREKRSASHLKYTPKLGRISHIPLYSLNTYILQYFIKNIIIKHKLVCTTKKEKKKVNNGKRDASKIIGACRVLPFFSLVCGTWMLAQPWWTQRPACPWKIIQNWIQQTKKAMYRWLIHFTIHQGTCKNSSIYAWGWEKTQSCANIQPTKWGLLKYIIYKCNVHASAARFLSL